MVWLPSDVPEHWGLLRRPPTLPIWYCGEDYGVDDSETIALPGVAYY
jgi:hypothetical protein